MATELSPNSDTNLTTLLSGIIKDAQHLFAQQVELVRTELHADLLRTKQATQVIAIGVGVGLVATTLLSLALVHFLMWLTVWPVWVCYAVVGGLLAVIAGTFLGAGIRKFQSFNPLPDESLAGLKENLEWKTHLT